MRIIESKSMVLSLVHKQIVLGVTGSIAAYKSADLVRRLREQHARVRVVMTENAKRFITPLTMQALSGFPVHDDLFDAEAEAAMGHIELARWADVILVAPATADIMVRLALGQADDLLTTLCLATKAPLMLAPAMNQGMWKHSLTQHNLQALRRRKALIVGPALGDQACGDVGPGRMLEPQAIIAELGKLFETGTLRNCRLVITAGPTHEAIDPVRFISNGSSGKMGYSLAEAARDAGASVCLISGPVALKKPEKITCLHVTSAQEMYEAVMDNIKDCDIFISVAAVADYRPITFTPSKIHKTKENIQLKLTLNPDIVASVAKLKKRPKLVIGFAAETENLIEKAKQKRHEKKLDMIIANAVGLNKTIGEDENEVIICTKESEICLPRSSKQKLAREIIRIIATEFKRKTK